MVGLFGKVNVQVLGVTGQVEEVVHGNQAGLLYLELCDISYVQQCLKVAEGDCCDGQHKHGHGGVRSRVMGRTSPAAVPVASTGAKEGILGGQGSGLDPVDGVCIRVFSRDGTAGLALADERALQGSSANSTGVCLVGGPATHRDLGLVVVAELLELGKLLLWGQEGGV